MATIINHPTAIRSIQIRSQIHVVKMEARGMKRSGASLTSMLKKHYGLKIRASYEDVLAKLQEDLEQSDTEFLADAHFGPRA